jgi:hypothetical protein
MSGEGASLFKSPAPGKQAVALADSDKASAQGGPPSPCSTPLDFVFYMHPSLQCETVVNYRQIFGRVVSLVENRGNTAGLLIRSGVVRVCVPALHYSVSLVQRVCIVLFATPLSGCAIGIERSHEANGSHFFRIGSVTVWRKAR